VTHSNVDNVSGEEEIEEEINRRRGERRGEVAVISDFGPCTKRLKEVIT
jgi:hypothetical protein